MHVAEIEQACGEGLAEQSALPAMLGELMAATADVLEFHLTALSAGEEDGRPERDAYVNLAKAHRDAAARLRAVGEEMAGYRDLPKAKHDPAVLSSPQAAGTFERFVQVEQQLLELLGERVERDRAMLAEMHERE